MKQIGGSRPGESVNINRDFYQGHQHLMMDYFWPENLPRPGSSEQEPVYSDLAFERLQIVSLGKEMARIPLS